MLAKDKNNERYVSGLIGERLAVAEMEKQGFTLVKQRYKTDCGEIDLIVENAGRKLLVFVEVKRRKVVYDYGSIISQNQWHRIYNSAELFLSQNFDKYKDYSIRYDAFIFFTDSKNIYHIENIFPYEK